jgi:Spy/CpxP family protein refolding chaperone
MSKRCLLAATLLVVLSTVAAPAAQPGAAGANADLGILLDTIRANRKALVAVNLKLTEDEAAKFWPLYDRYQQEIAATGDRLAAVIDDYTANFQTLSNDKALQLVDQYLAAEADRIKVRRDYVAQFSAILPGRSVARLYQIENKMDAVIRYDLAATIPVVEESAAPAGN